MAPPEEMPAQLIRRVRMHLSIALATPWGRPMVIAAALAMMLPTAAGAPVALAPQAPRQGNTSAPPSTQPRSGDRYEVVDPMVGDRNALSMSSRMMPLDLSPHGFRNVYRVPGRSDLLMRTDGALYAIFSQSEYIRDPKYRKQIVMKPLVPAATIYYIGRPNFMLVPSTGMSDGSFRPQPDRTAPAAPKNLESMPGVQRVVGVSHDASIESLRSARVEARLDSTHPRVSMPDEDISYPPVARSGERVAAPVRTESGEAASDPHAAPSPADAAPAAPASAPAPAPAPAPAATAPAAAPPPRSDRPGFQQRIDELIGRAKKAQ